MVLSHRGYTAWVESGGVPLEEYGCNTQGKVISCYVCSEEGKVSNEPPRISGVEPTDWMADAPIRSSLYISAMIDPTVSNAARPTVERLTFRWTDRR